MFCLDKKSIYYIVLFVMKVIIYINVMKVNKLLRIQITMDINNSNKSRCPKPYDRYILKGYITFQNPSSYITKMDTKPHSHFKTHQHHIIYVSTNYNSNNIWSYYSFSILSYGASFNEYVFIIITELVNSFHRFWCKH